jgi:pilus assembly protein CpaE
VPLYRDLLDLASQRVIVFEPTLAGVRDALRLRSLHDGANRSMNTVLVLNRDGMPGGVTHTQIEEALGGDPDLIIPDMPKRLAAAANMGEPAVRERSFFRVRVQDLARLVAFNRLLDSSTTPTIAMRREEIKRGWRIWRTK